MGAAVVAALDESARRILLIDAPGVLGWAQWRGQDADVERVLGAFRAA